MRMRCVDSEVQGGEEVPRACARAVSPRAREVAAAIGCACAAALLLGGCMMIGPDYEPPPAPLAEDWIDGGPDGEASAAAADEGSANRLWWTLFEDPVLDTLVERAYRDNPTVQVAGVRVLEALARRGVAIGGLFPQQQEAVAGYWRGTLSENRADLRGLPTSYENWQLGLDAAWELDLWGRLRRGIEAADADVLAAVATYDDVLVTLIAEVATNYIALRTFEERLEVVKANVEIQRRSFEIAHSKFEGGAVTQLDSAQAASLLESTQSSIPDLLASIRQTENNLCILLGMPPRDLRDLLGAPKPIPRAPAEVAIGIPAELLRQRPDVRRAERLLAAQSAQIGIAKADLLPRLSLIGTIALTAQDFAQMFEGGSFEAFGGPTLSWAILNYGRINNNIRIQDARFQQQIAVYESTVLRAQGEAENAIASFLGAQRQVDFLGRSVEAATQAVEVADLQYREGAADYTRVLNTQQFLVDAQDRLLTAREAVALSLASLYKALGGGWEVRLVESFTSEETLHEMRERTRWGSLSNGPHQHDEVEAAGEGTERERGWWRWRWWWPKW